MRYPFWEFERIELTKIRGSMNQIGCIWRTSRKTYGFGSKLNHLELDHRFWSMFPLTRVPFRVTIFERHMAALWVAIYKKNRPKIAGAQ